MSDKIPVSAVILTLNEEKNIASAVKALHWCDEVIVFDSFSTDRTCEIAESLGAKVFKRKFDNYAAQRNAAMQLPPANSWILMADADEIWDEEIGRVIGKAINDECYRGTTIFHFRRKDMFMGKWLKHNIGAGTWFGRCLKAGEVHIEREINEEYNTEGIKSYIPDIRFIHYPFSNGMHWWLERHNRYSDMEAKTTAGENASKFKLKDLFTKDPALRRKTMKRLLYRLPGRPLIVFFSIYFLKLGFLDGAAGFHYCVLRSFYEYMISVKKIELEFAEQGKSL